MPLVIKDYNWEETPKSLAITVPLKGVKKDKVDIFSTDELIKVRLTTFSGHLIGHTHSHSHSYGGTLCSL